MSEVRCPICGARRREGWFKRSRVADYGITWSLSDREPIVEILVALARMEEAT